MGVKKIPSLDQVQIIGDFINTGIIRPVQALHHIGVGRKFKPA